MDAKSEIVFMYDNINLKVKTLHTPEEVINIMTSATMEGTDAIFDCIPESTSLSDKLCVTRKNLLFYTIRIPTQINLIKDNSKISL